jgi:hypothetical protein
MGEISEAAVKYIEKKQQERQRERQFGAMKGYLAERYNRAATPGTAEVPARAGTPDTPGQIPSRPISPAGQPYAGPMEPGLPIRGIAPTAAVAGTPPTAGRDVGPEVEMLRQMGLAPEAAMQEIRGRYTPKYTQFTGPQGELDQWQVDAEGNRVLPGTRESLRPPIPKATPNRESIGTEVGADGYYYNLYKDPATHKTVWEKTEVRAPESKVGAGKETPQARNAEKYRAAYLASNQDVTNIEQYYGKDKLSAWREELKKDPEAQNFAGLEGYDFAKAMEEYAAQSAEKAAKAEKIKALKAYEKSLSSKQSHAKMLNGLGYQVDEDTGELNKVNPKAAKGKKEVAPSGDKSEKAKKFLDEQGYDSSDESVKTFLKNNPHF